MTPKLFEDLGFSPQKAAALKLKADLHTKIVKAASRNSQRELETILQTSQPRISDLLRGKMSKFSLDMLVFYAERLGLETSIKTHVRTRGASVGVANFVRKR
jgi:predicted XRE-type DNA-binding protein